MLPRSLSQRHIHLHLLGNHKGLKTPNQGRWRHTTDQGLTGLWTLTLPAEQPSPPTSVFVSRPSPGRSDPTYCVCYREVRGVTWGETTKEQAGTPGAPGQTSAGARWELIRAAKLFPALPAVSTSVSNLTTDVCDVVTARTAALKESRDSFSGPDQIPAFHFTAQRTPTNDLLLQTQTQTHLLLPGLP